MRSGSYIQALGRQSFEPSQPALPNTFNPLPSQQSQERQRQLIKAQNDVLATVGVCLRDTKQSLEKTESLMAENEVGLLVGAVDLTVTYLASWPLVGIRNRLQTYRGFQGFRYRDVIKLAWRGSTWGELFCGMPAHIYYQVVNLARDYGQARIWHVLQNKPFFKDSATGRPKRQTLLRFIDKCVSLGSWFMIYPLWHHSNLQTLHLLPPSPLFPSLRTFIPFSPWSPISLPTITGPLLSVTTAKSLLFQAATSYFLHSLVMQSISAALQYYLFKRILEVLPRPSKDSGCNCFTEPEDYPEEPNTMTIEAVDIDNPEDFHGITATMEDAAAAAAPSTHTTYTATITLDPVTGELLSPSQPDDGDPLEIEAEEPTRPLLPPRPPTPPRRRRRSSPSRPPPCQSSLPSSHQHGRSQLYRQTTLSSHPVDVVASHAADCIANSLIVTAESAVLRMLARNILLSRGFTPDGLVYPPFQIRGPGQPLVSKALIAGEWGLMWCLFEATWAVSTFVGVRWFGYQRGYHS